MDSAEFRDAILDILSQTRTEYQVTVAEAKATDDIDRVAELWKETHAFYLAMLTLWQGLNVLLRPKDAVLRLLGRAYKEARASERGTLRVSSLKAALMSERDDLEAWAKLYDLGHQTLTDRMDRTCSARTPRSRSGLVRGSGHECPRFLHRYSPRAGSLNDEQRDTHPGFRSLRACLAQRWLYPTLSWHSSA